jgi:hypothetical protein
MCPACIGGVALMIAGVVSAGGLTAVVMNRLGAKKGTKKLVQNPNPKEESWQK